MRRRIAWLVAFLFLLGARTASAEPVDPERLFAEGSALMEQGKYAEALPKLEKAQKADPGIGTMFNIGVCQAELGRLGTAYRTFREVTLLARASGKRAREEAARAKAEEIRARAPAFAVHSPEQADVTVRIDGAALTKEDWAFYPVDAVEHGEHGEHGEHLIEAVAPAKNTWSTTRPTPAAGKVEEVTIPGLEVAQSTKVVTVTAHDNRRTLGFVIGGVGVAGLITAGVTSFMLIDAHSTAEDDCPNKVCRNPDGTQNKDGADAVNRGSTLLPINAIAWGVAAVGIGVGTYFILTSGKKDSAKVALSPTGASLVGSF